MADDSYEDLTLVEDPIQQQQQEEEEDPELLLEKEVRVQELLETSLYDLGTILSDAVKDEVIFEHVAYGESKENQSQNHHEQSKSRLSTRLSAAHQQLLTTYDAETLRSTQCMTYLIHVLRSRIAYAVRVCKNDVVDDDNISSSSHRRSRSHDVQASLKAALVDGSPTIVDNVSSITITPLNEDDLINAKYQLLEDFHQLIDAVSSVYEAEIHAGAALQRSDTQESTLSTLSSRFHKRSKSRNVTLNKTELIVQRARELREKYAKEEEHRLHTLALERQRKEAEVAARKRRQVEQSKDAQVLAGVDALMAEEKARERQQVVQQGRQELSMLLHAANRMKQEAQEAEDERIARNASKQMERQYNLEALRLLRRREAATQAVDAIQQDATAPVSKQDRIKRALQLAQQVRAAVDINKSIRNAGGTFEEAKAKYEQQIQLDQTKQSSLQSSLSLAKQQLATLEAEPDSGSDSTVAARLGRPLTLAERQARIDRRTLKARARAAARRKVAELQEMIYHKHAERTKREAATIEEEMGAFQLAKKLQWRANEKRQKDMERRAYARAIERETKQVIRQTLDDIIFEVEAPEREEADVAACLNQMVCDVEDEELHKKVNFVLEDLKSAVEANLRQDMMEDMKAAKQHEMNIIEGQVSKVLDSMLTVVEQNHNENVQRFNEARDVRKQVIDCLNDMTSQVVAIETARLDATEAEQREEEERQRDTEACVQDLLTQVEVNVSIDAVLDEITVEHMLGDMVEAVSVAQDASDKADQAARLDIRRLMGEMLDTVDERAHKQSVQDVLEATNSNRVKIERVKRFLRRKMPAALSRARARIEARRRGETQAVGSPVSSASSMSQQRLQAGQVLSALVTKQELARTKAELEQLRAESAMEKEAVLAEAMRRLKMQQMALEEERKANELLKRKAAVRAIEQGTYWFLRKKRLKQKLKKQQEAERQRNEQMQVYEVMEFMIGALETDEREEMQRRKEERSQLKLELVAQERERAAYMKKHDAAGKQLEQERGALLSMKANLMMTTIDKNNNNNQKKEKKLQQEQEDNKKNKTKKNNRWEMAMRASMRGHASLGDVATITYSDDDEDDDVVVVAKRTSTFKARNKRRDIAEETFNPYADDSVHEHLTAMSRTYTKRHVSLKRRSSSIARGLWGGNRSNDDNNTDHDDVKERISHAHQLGECWIS